MTNQCELTAEERASARVLIIEPDDKEREALRSALSEVGFSNVLTAPDHASGLKRCEESRYDFVIFDAKDSTLPALEFLQKLLIADEDVLPVPCSSDLAGDNVFHMLQLGARGYIYRPIKVESVVEVLAIAAKGEQISEDILRAEDRNVAFAAVMATQLDSLAKVAQESRKYDSAAREVDSRLNDLREATELAKLFSAGGEDAIVAALEQICLSRGEGPASRLGRARRRLQEQRTKEDETPQKPSEPSE